MEIENDEIKTNTVTYVDYLNKKIYEVQVRYSLFHRKLDAGQIAKVMLLTERLTVYFKK